MLQISGMTLYDVQDLAERLGLNAETIHTLIQRGKLKGKKLGKKWYVNEFDLTAYSEAKITPE